MNIFRRDKVTVINPAVTSRSSNEELGNPISHTEDSVKKSNNSQDSVRDAKSEVPPKTKTGPGVMGVLQKVNPFRPAAQSSSTAGENAEGVSTDNKENPGMLKGTFQKLNPFKSSTPTQGKKLPADTVDHQARAEIRQNSPSLHSDCSSSTGSLAENNNSTEKQKRAEEVELMDPAKVLEPGQEVQIVNPAEVLDPGEGNLLDCMDVDDDLADWWKTVEGWEEWNQANPFEEDEGEAAVEAVADRVFMAARLFVRLFNLRGASLQQRILELLSLADAADNFHKKTVTASVGGGVASVAGSITTITGLILAPFTMGTSLIVTAVGIGVATAGGVASASANITDTMHSKTDRKKVEKMIQEYQEEMRDIKECLEFVQVGMETLEEWNFEQYAESISQKHLNQNVKHVMKEGGRAGKALLINTDSLISTVQVLSVAGGAAKAAQVMSVTTGVMSGLFLALDMFFLAKDSMELRKGAKTEFAAKIREVCKDLQNGLLELNSIKERLQMTMDQIEIEEEGEEDEEEGEEGEDEEEEKNLLKAEPYKVAGLAE